MKRSTLYFPLTLALLFGLAIGLVPTGPAYGDNIPGCQGIGSSTATVILAGRVVTPSTILRTANGQPCGANEAGLNIVAMTRTVVVSPNGTATQNGAALLAAMNVISNAGPSASNPWLLKLEPGNYDLGSGSLILKPYVGLEGSGEGTTTISSTIVTTFGANASGATLVMASNTEARFLRVVNAGPGDNQSGVLVMSGQTGVTVTHLTVSSSGVSNNFGIFNDGGTLTIQDSTLSASGGGNDFGFQTSSGTTIIKNSTLSASGGTGYNDGLLNAGGTIFIQNSTLSGSGGVNSSGLVSNNGTTTIQNSTLSASAGNVSAGITNNNGMVMVGASQLAGSPPFVGTITCVASYKADFTALTC